MRFVLKALVVAFLVGSSSLEASAQQPAPAPAPSANPAFDAAKVAAEALGPAEVAAMQRALIWTGDLNTLASGEFGKRTFDGIKAFQRRAKGAETGILLPAERAALDKAAAKAATGYGFKTVTEQGVSVGYPAKLAASRAEGRFGPKFSSPSGNVTVDILRYPAASHKSADALFQRLKTERPGRDITYSLSRPDAFVITGTVDGKSFYMRFLKTATDTRGFVVGWDPSLSPQFDRVPIAMAVSLALAGAGGTEPKVADSVAVEPAVPARSAGPPVALAPGASRAARQGVGFVIGGPRNVLTTARLVAGCRAVQTQSGSSAMVVAGDAGNDLALVRLASDAPAHAALRSAPLAPGASVTVVAAKAGAITRGEATVAALVGPGDDTRRFTISAGAAGGGVFDEAGALAGLTSSDGAAVAMKPLFLSAFLRANGAALDENALVEPNAAAMTLVCDPSKG